MGGSFSTSEQHAKPALQPLRVASLKGGVYEEAKNLVGDLPGWELIEADDHRLVLVCRRDGGVLGGMARIEIRVEGPEGIPSSTVHVSSRSTGGLLSRDKRNVTEFLVPFHRRVC
jgi:hypothetical protein